MIYTVEVCELYFDNSLFENEREMTMRDDEYYFQYSVSITISRDFN